MTLSNMKKMHPAIMEKRMRMDVRPVPSESPNKRQYNS